MSTDNRIENDNTIIITGYSGAGMSSVLKALEDMGLEVFDNFPLSLVDPLLNDPKSKGKQIAIGIDTRTRGFSPETILKTCETHNAKLVFISCDESILQHRFTETRRRHPLAQDKSAKSGIQQEQKLLAPVLDHASLTIDTSMMSVHDLRHILENHFQKDPDKKLAITLMSFGFKYGPPREADIVMDVRFLKNPHWDKELRPLTGKDKAVGDHIEQDKDYAPFLEHFQTMIAPLIPRYQEEGKSYLTIAIGCTGGRHRSVYTVEKLQKWFAKNGSAVHIEHRDLKE